MPISAFRRYNENQLLTGVNFVNFIREELESQQCDPIKISVGMAGALVGKTSDLKVAERITR
jgi:hypothetical protein